jgi:hypothetical protein
MQVLRPPGCMPSRGFNSRLYCLCPTSVSYRTTAATDWPLSNNLFCIISIR